MILRKPYAFIIKHFRLIHLLMFACLVFILTFINDINSLFTSLQSTNTFMYAGTDTYINNFVYYVVFALLFLSAVIFWLLKEKKKPTKLYLGLIIYCVALFVGIGFLFSLLTTMQENLVESEQLILGKDLSFIFSLPNYAFIVICFIRGIGFNIKQFNFSKDIEELQIADKDSAEFEVLIGQNNYKYLRTFRRTIREIKYYILENKFVITCFCALLLVFFVGYGIYYYNQYMKTLNASEATSVDGITYAVRRAYITAHDYNGNTISNKYKYVVIDMSFHNSTALDKTLNLDNITLANGELVYFNTLTKNGKFYDLGIPYTEDEVIKPGETKDATLTFELPSSVNSKNFVLRVQYDIDSTLDDIVARYRKFDIKATNIDSDNEKKVNNINETINVNVVNRNAFSLTVTGYNLLDSYDSKYVTCKSIDSCLPLSYVITPNKNNVDTMLVIDYKGIMYDDAIFTKTFNTYNKIFENYAIVSYTLYNKSYSSKVNVVSNSDVDGKIFINVDRRIMNATKISLLFNFRDQTFEVPLLTNTLNG